MKLSQLQTENNQHVVAVEKDGVLRCYFENSSLHTCGVTLQSLRNDIANHGESVVGFDALPLIAQRTTKAGKMAFTVAK